MVASSTEFTAEAIVALSSSSSPSLDALRFDLVSTRVASRIEFNAAETSPFSFGTAAVLVGSDQESSSSVVVVLLAVVVEYAR